MATIYRRGQTFTLQWTENGTRQRRSLGHVTQAEAEAQRIALETRLAGAKPASGPSTATWALEYAHWHASEYPDSYFRVEQILRSHLLPFFGTLPVGAITKREAESYKQVRLAAGAAPATVAKELRTLQAMINKAVDWDIIPRNPITGVHPPRDIRSSPPRWYGADELQRLYAVELEPRPSTTEADQELHRRYRWAWQLFANSGLRRSEGMNLQWKDIGKEEIRVLSEPGARTKSGKWRLVPITVGASMALESLRGETYVLPQVEPESLSRAFIRTAGRAGLDGSIHCLRHTYCSHLVMAGVPLRTVQILAGHASFTTTERYAHLSPGHLKEAARGLSL